MGLFQLRPHRHEDPPQWVGVLIASWVLILVEHDLKPGLPGLTAMIGSSTWHFLTPEPEAVSAESDWPEPEPSSEIL